jgi:hypothetical protein
MRCRSRKESLSMKKELTPRKKKIEFNRETLRQLGENEYVKAAGGSSPSFSHLPHCPLCCP